MAVQANEVYKHYKGDYYVVICLSKHTEDLTDLVTYRRIKDDTYWTRPLSMFCSTVSTPAGEVMRFQLLD